MFCPKCGSKNRDGANFCKQCGARLTDKVLKLVNNRLPKSSQLIPAKIPENSGNSQEILSRKSKWVANAKRASLAVTVFVVSFIVMLEVVAYRDYYLGLQEAKQDSLQGNYSGALDKMQEVNRSGLYQYAVLPKDKEAVRILTDEYSKSKGYQDTLDQAKRAEAIEDFDKAKKLLASISGKTDFAGLGEVNQELIKVNDAITAKIQADANAKVAAANAQAKVEATNRKKAQEEAARAAANAAANQAAAQAAQQEAQRQQAQAEAARQQAQAAAQAAAQAQAIALRQNEAANSNYIIALGNAMRLENTANNEIDNAITAFIASNYSLALSDLVQSENDSYNAERLLPETYPAIFQSVNSDIVNAANYCNLAAREFYTSMVNFTPGDQAFADQRTGSYYYSKIKSDLNAIGF